MKKVLIGCGVVFLLMVMLAVGAIIFLVVGAKKIGARYEQAGIAVQQLKADFPFAEPVDETADLDAARLNDYFVVRDQLVDRTMKVSFFAELEKASTTKVQPNIGMGDILGLMTKDIPLLLQDYAAALRTSKMSPEEYAWFSRRVFEAIRGGAKNGDAEFIKMWDELETTRVDFNKAMAQQRQQGNQQLQLDLDSEFQNAEEVEVPPQHIAAILRHKDQLTKRPVMIVIEILFGQVLDQVAVQGMGANTWPTPAPAMATPIPAEATP